MPERGRGGPPSHGPRNKPDVICRRLRPTVSRIHRMMGKKGGGMRIRESDAPPNEWRGIFQSESPPSSRNAARGGVGSSGARGIEMKMVTNRAKKMDACRGWWLKNKKFTTGKTPPPPPAPTLTSGPRRHRRRRRWWPSSRIRRTRRGPRVGGAGRRRRPRRRGWRRR